MIVAIPIVQFHVLNGWMNKIITYIYIYDKSPNLRYLRIITQQEEYIKRYNQMDKKWLLKGREDFEILRVIGSLG